MRADQMLKPRDVAARLSVSLRTVQRLIQAGELGPRFRIGRRAVRVSEEGVSRYLRTRAIA